MTTMTAEDEIFRRLELYKEMNKRDYLIDAVKYCLWSWIAHKKVFDG